MPKWQGKINLKHPLIRQFKVYIKSDWYNLSQNVPIYVLNIHRNTHLNIHPHLMLRIVHSFGIWYWSIFFPLNYREISILWVIKISETCVYQIQIFFNDYNALFHLFEEKKSSLRNSLFDFFFSYFTNITQQDCFDTTTKRFGDVQRIYCVDAFHSEMLFFFDKSSLMINLISDF